MTHWIIYACRTPYAVEVAEVIWRRDDEVAALVDNLPEPRGPAEPEAAVAIGAPLRTPEDVRDFGGDVATVIPLLTPGHRLAVSAEARGLGLVSFPPLVDPGATVARTAALGEGSVVNAAAVIAAESAVGRFVHVNRSASIGHHNVIADFASLGPGCVLSGHVRVGKGAFIGAGAVCAPKVAIGANATVGAGAVVVDDVPTGTVVAGNPARPLRDGDPGYGGVSVPG